MTFPELTTRINHALDQILPSADIPPATLHQAMRHAVLAGGKRLRPMLVFAAGRAMGEPGAALDAPACAVELIHTYSLIHDDLPAMDDDDLRRGRPTTHVVYGEAMAILAGDALQALAFEVLASDRTPSVSDHTRVHMLRCLGAACGSSGMAGGQALDLDAIGTKLSRQALEHMHHCKTGALIRASVRLGALAGGCKDAGQLDTLDEFAKLLGLAFQIRDDILDVESNSSDLGKTVGKDARQSKPTFSTTIGVDASRQYLDELTERADACLAGFGSRADQLRELAGFAARRTC